MTVNETFQIEPMELKDFPAPPSTETYLGIPHSKLFDIAMQIGTEAGFEYKSSTITIANEGKRAFMRLLFNAEYADRNFFIGVRSTYDKSARVAFASGAQVMVCSNLCVSGSDMVILRKHTPNALIDLEEMAQNMKLKAKDRYYEMIEFENVIKKIHVAPEQGNMIIGATLGSGIIPHGAYLEAIKHWKKPPFKEFEKENNLWGVYNALTWGAHRLPVNKKLSVNADITDFVSSVSNKTKVLL